MSMISYQRYRFVNQKKGNSSHAVYIFNKYQCYGSVDSRWKAWGYLSCGNSSFFFWQIISSIRFYESDKMNYWCNDEYILIDLLSYLTTLLLIGTLFNLSLSLTLSYSALYVSQTETCCWGEKNVCLLVK